LAKKEERGPWSWDAVWSVRARCEDPAIKLKWDYAIGFVIPDNGMPIQIDHGLNNYLNFCSVKELMEFLAGAPLPIVKLYFYKLPLPQAKKLLLNFRREDIEELKYAYNNPKPLGIGAPVIDGHTTKQSG
jgi:hypothetical protein